MFLVMYFSQGQCISPLEETTYLPSMVKLQQYIYIKEYEYKLNIGPLTYK